MAPDGGVMSLFLNRASQNVGGMPPSDAVYRPCNHFVAMLIVQGVRTPPGDRHEPQRIGLIQGIRIPWHSTCATRWRRRMPPVPQHPGARYGTSMSPALTLRCCAASTNESGACFPLR